MDQTATPALMTVKEVAGYLRIRERTIYELVRTHRIPHTRLSGKLLFPKQLIELWVAQSSEFPNAAAHLSAPPPVIAGSHDPLLEWSVRESDCELALLGGGSSDGLVRLASGKAVACGLHLIDPASGKYDPAIVEAHLTGLDFVVLEWARREQGLVIDAGNPKKIGGIADLRKRGVRVAVRQVGAGTTLLLATLLKAAGIEPDDLKLAPTPARTHTDIAIMVRDGEADTGLAIRAAANTLGLAFIPLMWERFDLVVRRLEFFEPPIQKLLAFTRTAAFRERAERLGGYDISATCQVVSNPRR